MSPAFGFDVDGTLTATPEAFRPMMSALVDSGHTVHVITGATYREKGSCYASPKWRREQIGKLGIHYRTHYTTLDIVRGTNLEQMGRAKAKLARNYKLVLMFEDEPVYADEIGKVCQVVMMDRYPGYYKPKPDGFTYYADKQEALW